MVPEGWRLPVTNVSISAFWELWWAGMPSSNIKPLRFLRGKDLVKSDNCYLSKGKSVMQWLEGAAAEPPSVLPEGVRHIRDLRSPAERDAVFVKVFLRMCSRLYPEFSHEDIENRRIIQESYLTFYPLLKKT